MKELNVYRQLTQLAYLPTYIRMIRGALELDVFSRLTQPMTANALAASAGWNEASTQALLDGLCSVGFLEKEDGAYVDAPDAAKYLAASSPEYAAGFLQVFAQGSDAPMDVAGLVREGPGPQASQQAGSSMDFTRYGETFRAAQRGCRQQEILRIVRSLPENAGIRRVLDLGCNTGLLGLAVIADDPSRSGCLMDMPPLQPLIDESIRLEGLQDRAQSIGGDFLTDGIGSGYDLILAVSVMVFAREDLPAFLKKLHSALAPGGVIVCVGEGVKPDPAEPWDMIMGYLPYRLQGADMAVRSGEIEKAAAKAGFAGIETRTELLWSGTQDIVILRK
ncbi:MAG: methyltransferase domain-containing protein [Clostridia bacterium]|nr:methyltransferase domain-containing protein [Clostridia bacterium]